MFSIVVQGAGKTSQGWVANTLYPIVAGLGLGLLISIIIPPKGLPPPRNADVIAGRLRHQLGQSVSCAGPSVDWPYDVHIIDCGDRDPRSAVEFGWGQESSLDAWAEVFRDHTWDDLHCAGFDSCMNQEVAPEGYADCVETGGTVIAVWGLTLRKAILREFGGKLISPC